MIRRNHISDCYWWIISILICGLVVCSCGAIVVRDRDLGQVFLANGFDFTGYDILLVTGISNEAVAPSEALNSEALSTYLQQQLVAKLREAGVFPIVTNDKAILFSADSVNKRILVLDGSFSELDLGTREIYFVGVGAGRMKVQLETNIRDARTNQLLFKASTRRTSDLFSDKKTIADILDEISESHGVYVKRIAPSSDPSPIKPIPIIGTTGAKSEIGTPINP